MGNTIDRSKIYYKTTNYAEDNCVYDYQYVDGLNKLPVEFDKNDRQSGFSFCNLDGLHYGWDDAYIREVTIPSYAIVKQKSKNSWRTDCIILGKRHPIHNVETMKLFGNKIYANYVSDMIPKKRFDKLNIWKEAKLWLEPGYRSGLSTYDLDILKWLSDNNIPYSCRINYFSHCNDVKTLDWWQKSSIKDMYNRNFPNDAIKYRNYVLLEWLSENKPELLNDNYFLLYDTVKLLASPNLKVFNWLLENKKVKSIGNIIKLVKAVHRRVVYGAVAPDMEGHKIMEKWREKYLRHSQL